MASRDDCDVLYILTEMNQVTADTQPISNRESVKQLISYLDRIYSVLESLRHIPHTDLAPAIRTALQGIRSSLDSVQDISTKYKSKSGLYLILHGRKLNQELEEITHKIGQWLALLPLAEVPEIREVKKKIEDLIREMQHAVYKVPESEQYVCRGLEKLSEQTENTMDKEVVNTIFMEAANLLGVDSEQDHGAMHREIDLLKEDLQDCNEIENKHLMEALQKTFESWSLVPAPTSVSDIEEDELTPYFDSFNCPLTKQVMKDPVVLQSRITYDRGAIEEWFRTCREQMRELTCPVTNQALTSVDLLPNLVLRQTIDEWSERSTTTRIRQAKQKLKSTISVDDIDRAEHALDDILRILDESSMNKYKLKDADLIPMILKLYHLKGAAELRSKALIVLHRMAIDDADNQDRMIDAGVLRPVVKSLSSNFEKECESAVKLLLELSKQQKIAAKIGPFKGALIYLAALTSRENLKVSVMAEETLKNLESVRSNVILMAEAGRLQPLLRLLSEGIEQDQIEVATFLATKILITSQKELVAKYGVHTLVNMLSSGSQTGKEAALGALRNLSELEDNVPVLIKAEVLPPLMNILFDLSFTRISPNSRIAAAKMLVCLCSVPGSWENAPVDPEGNTLESECVIHKLLGLLTHVTNDSKGELLQVLSSIVSSPQAAELVCGHVKTGNGIPTIISFLQGTEVAHCLSALNVISSLSEFIGTEMAEELRRANLLHRIKDILKGKSTDERTAAACIFSNLPLTDADLVSILEPELIKWIMDTILDSKSGKLTKSSTRPKLLVGLLGVLLHFACSSNDNIVEIMQRCDLMSLFVQQLTLQDEPLVKQKAAEGLRYLSERAHHFTRDSQRNPIKSSILSIFCCSTSKAPQDCPVHSGFCASNSFCLVTSKAVGPLLEVLQDKNYDVQLAAVSALSTILSDSVNLKGGVEELVRHEGIQHIFDLFFSQKPCYLQEKTVWMVERILRIEEYAQRHYVDEGLVKALVEAFKHGNPKTKQLAQQALTHMKELSGISAGRRKTRQVQ